tara:strand:- start:25 stop:147 length:123 start_codon:yes stop_codon:yes gene_type:complete
MKFIAISIIGFIIANVIISNSKKLKLWILYGNQIKKGDKK